MSSPAQAIASWYLFFVGMAAGLTALLLIAYSSVSPRWLRWLLLASGLCVASRYLAMAAFAISPDVRSVWGLRRCWLATSIGLTLPGVVALDQLVRDPRMTPTKLLQRFAPFLVAYGLVLLFGQFEPAADRLVGSYPRLIGWARWLLLLTQAAFVLGFCWLGVTVLTKLPLPHLRPAIASLIVAYLYLAVDGLLVTVGIWYFRPFLFSEMLAMAAIWFAFETAKRSTT